MATDLATSDLSFRSRFNIFASPGGTVEEGKNLLAEDPELFKQSLLAIEVYQEHFVARLAALLQDRSEAAASLDRLLKDVYKERDSAKETVVQLAKSYAKADQAIENLEADLKSRTEECNLAQANATYWHRQYKRRLDATRISNRRKIMFITATTAAFIIGHCEARFDLSGRTATKCIEYFQKVWHLGKFTSSDD